MADHPDQPAEDPETSALQQISDLRGEFRTLNATMTAFFSSFTPAPPPRPEFHDTPPHHIPQPQPAAPQFHDQFHFSHAHPPTDHYPSENQSSSQTFSPNPPAPPSQYAEHQKLPDVWFSGESSQLGSFLKDIQNFFHLRAVHFPSEARMIVWVSLHFGFRPSENQRVQSRSQNWYHSLIVQNARLQGKFSPYADLERVPFLLPALASLAAFENSLISYFGDKNLAETARATLDSCRQGSMSVEEYNSQFGSLAYLVDMSDGDRVARYINGLNLNVHMRVTGQAWRAAKTLKDKMDLAVEGAKDLEMMSRISNPHSAPKPKPAPLYQHPHSSQRSSDAMDIDAATTHPNQRPVNPFIALFRRVCMAQRVSAATTLPPFSGNEASPASSAAAPLGDFGYDEVYEDVVDADIATVKVQLDTSRSGRIMVPVSFQVSSSKSVIASVLVDTGAMANFVSK
ncbi:hypothetical protein Pst134EB_005958 [Puccinia striiformis f. sp. tritici]|nr:hypothetical protein Pst134EB_005958 [Puccinia striiformis f. sp. tritici]